MIYKLIKVYIQIIKDDYAIKIWAYYYIKFE